MNELHDYWIEQRLYLTLKPTYEHRLRLTDTIYVEQHKPNKITVPLDQQPRYIKERKKYLNLPKRIKLRREDEKTIKAKVKFLTERERSIIRKEKSRYKAKGEDHMIVQPEILTDTDISDISENDWNNIRIHYRNRKLRKTPTN